MLLFGIILLKENQLLLLLLILSSWNRYGLEFPKYAGNVDPTYWIKQAKQFFNCHEIGYNDQVVMATYHLEGHAQLWYGILYEEEGDLS